HRWMRANLRPRRGDADHLEAWHSIAGRRLGAELTPRSLASRQEGQRQPESRKERYAADGLVSTSDARGTKAMGGFSLTDVLVQALPVARCYRDCLKEGHSKHQETESRGGEEKTSAGLRDLA